MTKNPPAEPLPDDPLPLEGIVTENQFVEISSLGEVLQDLEGLMETGATRSRQTTDAELMEMRAKLD